MTKTAIPCLKSISELLKMSVNTQLNLSIYNLLNYVKTYYNWVFITMGKINDLSTFD